MSIETYDKCIAGYVHQLNELVQLLSPAFPQKHDDIVNRTVLLARERIEEFDDSLADSSLLAWLGQMACMVLFEYC